MEAHVTFLSNSFPPAPGEADELINEGTYGKKLAKWLQAGLKRQGLVTGDLVVEDFGWVLMLREEGLVAFLACSTPYEVSAKDQECHCTITVNVPLFKKLFGGKDAAAYLARVKAAVGQLIAEHGDIRQPEWTQR